MSRVAPTWAIHLHSHPKAVLTVFPSVILWRDINWLDILQNITFVHSIDNIMLIGQGEQRVTVEGLGKAQKLQKRERTS